MEAPSQRINITICGDGGCGKSSITLRLVRSQWTNAYDPTIEDSYSLTRRIDGQTYHLSITDTAGQEEYRGMWASSNLGADAFLLVYDITSIASLQNLGGFLDLIELEEGNREEAWLRNGGQHGDGSPGWVPPVKIVAGNKCDLQSQRQVEARTGLDWARRRGCGFMETSAWAVVNVEETFALIVRRVVEARRLAAGVAERKTEPVSSSGQQQREKAGREGARRSELQPQGAERREEKSRKTRPDWKDSWRTMWRRLKCWG